MALPLKYRQHDSGLPEMKRKRWSTWMLDDSRDGKIQKKADRMIELAALVKFETVDT